jgi:hypothetical protein
MIIADIPILKFIYANGDWNELSKKYQIIRAVQISKSGSTCT